MRNAVGTHEHECGHVSTVLPNFPDIETFPNTEMFSISFKKFCDKKGKQLCLL